MIICALQAIPPSSPPHHHSQHIPSLSQSCSEDNPTSGGASSTSAGGGGGGGSSPHTPIPPSHHSHPSPLSQSQSSATNGFSSSSSAAASSMFSAQHYPRANSWYMSQDLNPGPADFSSSPFAMFDSQRLLSQGQSQSASCQLAAAAAFRAPYKAANSYGYDCTKF